jgi:hypothetical protein
MVTMVWVVSRRVVRRETTKSIRDMWWHWKTTNNNLLHAMKSLLNYSLEGLLSSHKICGLCTIKFRNFSTQNSYNNFFT